MAIYESPCFDRSEIYVNMKKGNGLKICPENEELIQDMRIINVRCREKNSYKYDVSKKMVTGKRAPSSR